ncbi:energy transducer TonB [Microbulbifer aggregans]|uniref:energy transducer TonB family protein n=1 Tax=Microbulbifer aggregans TaxID=1769779 RepID=UPI001CFD281A|nr:energy transducer TonB [Microbulbifer aggregans]
MKALHFALALPLLAASLSVDATSRVSGVKQQSASDQYESTIIRHTLKNIRYPRRAQTKGQQGEVHLRVNINKSGEVQDIKVLEESSFSSLNREALRSVERANPYPVIPAALGTDNFSVTVPIVFKLED